MDTTGLVIFDLDGTLLNTLGDLADAVNHTLGEYGMPGQSTEHVRCSVGNGAANLMRQCVPGGSDHPEFEACLESYKDYYQKNLLIKTRPYDGIPELLAALRRRGIRIAVLSNKPDDAVKALVREIFGPEISAAAGESEQNRRKPSPDGVFQILKELDVPAEHALYVGDSDVDIKTAHNAGLPAVGVTWGFRDRGVLEAAGADYIIDRPEELDRLIGDGSILL
jgi:phosphoglycolate phosphatase